ncbi:MAG: tRNA (adenosine(37)-N6)-dimethylallyltransferase MiaA, partial [Planctomyces sp.]
MPLRRGQCLTGPVPSARRQQAAEQNGPRWLHAELQRRDPAAAAKLHPNDMRRLIRAIEVFEITG